MRGSETMAMAFFFFFFGCFRKFTLALLRDCNFGIRIGSKGQVGQPQCKVGLGAGRGACCGWARCGHPSPCLG
jgi:hypothetical protein